ncbi:23S rRNA (uracil(1939)-C(5))-methyltransferase RlmD [Hydrogenibacillus sp. N12]|uniref:23S rRNA (uracil(1939)-C(5))-methyltransferase RlmD n=1 Tax=Hydrogenibacillus sp. N12 TaxID=2866627 RepID=UPI00207C0A72|nr:23S rRNA (uracil(1939)-C(5))-methyltransferase RlmD [Hydrogenibacillus sp. N12]
MAEGIRRPPLRAGERRTVEIVGLTHDAQGIARPDGFAVFVPGALPGETVEIVVEAVRASYAVARLARIVRASPERVAPPCPVYGRCGGCQLQPMTYAAQLAFKENAVRDALRRLGGFIDPPVLPIIGMREPWRYRNKAQLAVRRFGRRTEMGYYARKTHTLVPIDDCLLEDSSGMAALRAARDAIRALSLPPYNEVHHEGLIRHLVVRTARTGEAMLVVVTNGPHLPGARRLATAVRRAVPSVVSVVQNINSRRTNVILGEESRVIAGRETIEETLLGVRFRISARSFFQVNPEQTEALYRIVEEMAGLTGRETVIDAYAGVGTIALVLARKAAEVIGLEAVPEAVRDAEENARRNGIENARFLAGAAEDLLTRFAEEGKTVDAVVVDPPRKGLDPKAVDAILRLRPRRLVYVSCNPSTLARDARLFAAGGLRLAAARPVDLFPQTVHVETVALFERDVNVM